MGTSCSSNSDARDVTTVVIELLAFCIGQTVHAVRLPHDVRTAPRFVAADQSAKALNLDMADWWAPTGETYLGRVKKEQILEAICEGTKETNLEDLRKMNKADLVAAADVFMLMSDARPARGPGRPKKTGPYAAELRGATIHPVVKALKRLNVASIRAMPRF